MTKPAVGEGVVPVVAAASRQAVSMPVPVASTSAVRPLQSAPPIPQTAPNSDDLMQVMAAAIEAALKPMRQQPSQAEDEIVLPHVRWSIEELA